MSTKREHLIREAEGVAHRGHKQCPADLDLEWQVEAMRDRERKRRTDEADGYFKPEEEENE
jgi:hypothetical protein